MGNEIFGSTDEMIESRKYLLSFQKEALIDDLGLVESDTSHMESMIDRVFYRLFGEGWDALTPAERLEIEIAWKGK